MSLSTDTIDQIVANVLKQLGGGDAIVTEESERQDDSAAAEPVIINERVLTAETLNGVKCQSTVHVSSSAVLTPTAKDLIRERKLHVITQVPEKKESVAANGTPGVCIVRHTAAVKRVLADLGLQKSELVSCPDDAAKFAISSICRGDASFVVLFVQQIHRAVCLANRNAKVKAVHVCDAGDVKQVRKELRANVWCVNPEDRSYYELRNVLKQIMSS